LGRGRSGRERFPKYRWLFLFQGVSLRIPGNGWGANIKKEEVRSPREEGFQGGRVGRGLGTYGTRTGTGTYGGEGTGRAGLERLREGSLGRKKELGFHLVFIWFSSTLAPSCRWSRKRKKKGSLIGAGWINLQATQRGG